MKVFALVILFVASASAKGSGPYLPSGWKPEGPAFYLPSEEKVAESPVNEVNLEGSEASGSDFLREYGPPNVVEISQNLINQGLPDVATEQTFGVIAQIDVKDEGAVQELEETEVKAEQTSTEQSDATPEVVAEETATSSAPIEEIEQIVEISQTTVANNVETANVDVTQFEYVVSSQESTESSEISQNSQTTEVANEESTSSNEESSIVEAQVVSEQVSQESNQESTLISQESSESQSVVSETESTQVVRLGLQELQNIPDIIASLEQEVKVQQAEVNQAVSDLSKAAGELEQAPEGFLEYGPPGFAEYGPPKSDLNEEVKLEDQSFESNAARRRRFSPKFRSPKKH